LGRERTEKTGSRRGHGVDGKGAAGRVMLGISSCLLGRRVRYDGGQRRDPYLVETLGRFVDWLPVCPEVEAGLGVPREAMRLVGVPGGEPGQLRLVGRKSGADYTAELAGWTSRRLRLLADEELCGFVLKSRSPSCALGRGLFARAFIEAFPTVPVEDERRLGDAARRGNFIERVLVLSRWRELRRERATVGRLVSFHSDHKYLIMAHSPAHLRQLGRLVAGAKEVGPAEACRRYLPLLMEGMGRIATVRKNVNVLQHMMGYFSKFLTTGEKRELLTAIDDYHRQRVPLVVPLTLLRHYARKYDEPFLKRQYYLNPDPAELMLKNRV